MRLSCDNDNGRGLIEHIFSITVIFIICGIIAGKGFTHLKEMRSSALQNQLTNLKYSLELYKILEGHYPEDLKGLDKKLIVIKEDSFYGKKYLELQSHDKEGYPVDVYGHRFIYDSKSGMIKRGRR